MVKQREETFDIGYPIHGAKFLNNNTFLVTGGLESEDQSKLTALTIDFERVKKPIKRFRELKLNEGNQVPTTLDANNNIILLGSNENFESIRNGHNHNLQKFDYINEHLKYRASSQLEPISNNSKHIPYQKLIKISKNGKIAAIASSKQPTVIHILDPVNLFEKYEIETNNDVKDLDLSPDGKLLTYITSHTIELISIVTGKSLQRKIDFKKDYILSKVKFENDDNIIIGVDHKETIGVTLIKLAIKNQLKVIKESVINKKAKYVSCLTSNTVNSVIAVAFDDSSIVLLKSQSLKRIRHIPNVHRQTITRLNFSPDGKYLASVSLSNTINVIEIPEKLGVETFRVYYFFLRLFQLALVGALGFGGYYGWIIYGEKYLKSDVDISDYFTLIQHTSQAGTFSKPSVTELGTKRTTSIQDVVVSTVASSSTDEKKSALKLSYRSSSSSSAGITTRQLLQLPRTTTQYSETPITTTTAIQSVKEIIKKEPSYETSSHSSTFVEATTQGSPPATEEITITTTSIDEPTTTQIPTTTAAPTTTSAVLKSKSKTKKSKTKKPRRSKSKTKKPKSTTSSEFESYSETSGAEQLTSSSAIEQTNTTSTLPTYQRAAPVRETFASFSESLEEYVQSSTVLEEIMETLTSNETEAAIETFNPTVEETVIIKESTIVAEPQTSKSTTVKSENNTTVSKATEATTTTEQPYIVELEHTLTQIIGSNNDTFVIDTPKQANQQPSIVNQLIEEDVEKEEYLIADDEIETHDEVEKIIELPPLIHSEQEAVVIHEDLEKEIEEWNKRKEEAEEKETVEETSSEEGSGDEEESESDEDEETEQESTTIVTEEEPTVITRETSIPTIEPQTEIKKRDIEEVQQQVIETQIILAVPVTFEEDEVPKPIVFTEEILGGSEITQTATEYFEEVADIAQTLAGQEIAEADEGYESDSESEEEDSESGSEDELEEDEEGQITVTQTVVEKVAATSTPMAELLSTSVGDEEVASVVETTVTEKVIPVETSAVEEEQKSGAVDEADASAAEDESEEEEPTEDEGEEEESQDEEETKDEQPSSDDEDDDEATDDIESDDENIHDEL